MITLENVSISYGPKNIFKDFNSSFESEKTSVLIGPSGCGKSTLLKAILGLINIDDGYIRIDDRKVTDIKKDDYVETIGYMSQNSGLFPQYNVEDNVCLVAKLRGWSKEKRKRRFHELLDIANVKERLIKKFPCQLSGGERQRVSLMRALFFNPKVIILDEPMGAIDPLVRKSMQQELSSIFRKLKKTVILVTHDMREARDMGDKIVLLKSGKIEQQGSFEDLSVNPKTVFVKEFLELI